MRNNKIVIILLGIIIVMLILLVILFATDTITLNSSKTEDNNSTENSTQNSETEESESIRTNEEDINIIKNIFTNETVQFIFNNPGLTYCKTTESTIYTEEELRMVNYYKGNGYQKCTDYNSYEELLNYLKSFFTEEYFNNVILKENTYIPYSTVMNDGSIFYNYYEKDGNLYVAITGKGGNVEKNNILDNETTYEINESNKNEIIATIHATWQTAYDDNTTHSEIIKISVVKSNNNWQINSYTTNEQ